MLRKKGGDTRAAAALRGNVVGAPPKSGSRFDRQIKVPLHADDDDSLAEFAEVDGVTKQDLIRLAISRYLIDRRMI